MSFDVDWGRYKLVDLSQPVLAGPEEEHPIVVRRQQFPNGMFYHEITGGNTHAGTHVELPAHFSADSRAMEEFPLSAFMGRAVLAAVRETEGEEITGPILEASIQAPVRRDDIVVIRDDRQTISENNGGGAGPLLSLDAAHWLLGMGAKMLVFRTLRLGRTVPEQREFHDILLGRDIPIAHGAAHLDKLTRPEFYLIAWPARIHGIDSLWVRIAAIVER